MSSAEKTLPVSIVILTLNEEVNVEACIASCAESDDIHVLDSGSADRTAEIARRCGAQVWEHPFESFGRQRNWAIDNIPMKHEWVLHLDADERLTPELVSEMRRTLATNPKEAGFYLPNKLMFMGRWLRRAGAYPTYQMRLFHRDRMRFCDYGHGQRELTSGRIGTFQEPYVHYAFSKGLSDWFDKHNRYSTLEALQVLGRDADHWTIGDLVSSDRIARRRAWKAFGYVMPFRPQVRWFVTLFVLGGILEGRAGLSYARLYGTYEQMTSLKLRMMRARKLESTTGFEMEQAPGVRAPGAVVSDPTREAADGGGAAQRPLGAAGLPQTRPEPSPYSFREKLGRVIWMVVGKPLFRASFHNWYGFRRRLLKLFGAKLGKGVAIRPSVHVEIPWMLEIDDGAIVGDEAILYCLGRIRIGKRAIISQYAHLCAGTHDYTDPTFRLIRSPITIGDDVWIGADAFVGPGVTIGPLSVLGARSSAYKDLPMQQICVGNPAKPLRRRELEA